MLLLTNETDRIAAIFSWKRGAGEAYQQDCLRQLTGDPGLLLRKHATGQPWLLHSPWKVSMSHSQNKLAIALARDYIPGIDIEDLRDKIFRIAPRVFNEAELSMIAGMPQREALHILWGAKEALYKSYGNRGLIFRTDLLVDSFTFDPAGSTFTACLRTTFRYRLGYCFLPSDEIVVYTTGREKLHTIL